MLTETDAIERATQGLKWRPRWAKVPSVEHKSDRKRHVSPCNRLSVK
jgi:hypothetical protein